ncbi:ATP-binding cassette domain-containing protein [Demequina sp. SYSU T00192]|uniref:ATP-binding cassette domain-containing protein n=1 Tax=Demequina litoralis TaxID=3051660 RepID=A0ABT8G6W5_9MICO|nr:ATP-binding cassette domain-containing protein [Demequina sp. SYSU T00192]MDN4474875.1 ATP-binding cassette domain-containing protein [Demequina sp. SYSU T00192]
MDGPRIEIVGLTKRFGAVTAVEDASFAAEPGRVTGFLGPNGAGKSTTLRALLGLVSPTAGDALIGGRRYRDVARPATVVGAQLEPAFHPGRTARDHLRTVAPLAGKDDARCDEALAAVGMTEAADRRVGGFSMGMRQRLGLATALLGEPAALVLDEPANGLDPAGITWMRGFVRDFAARGGTVLLSSHLLGEVEQTVDDVVVIARGRIRHASSLSDLRALAHPAATLRSPDAARLAALARDWADARLASPTELVVPRAGAAEVGARAFAAGVEVHGLAETGETLEQVFLRLTEEAA